MLDWIPFVPEEVNPVPAASLVSVTVPSVPTVTYPNDSVPASLTVATVDCALAGQMLAGIPVRVAAALSLVPVIVGMYSETTLPALEYLVVPVGDVVHPVRVEV